MDFSYTEVQRMLQEQVQRFVQKSYDFETRARIIASEAGYSKENWALFAELGWLAVPFGEDDGGLGGASVDLIVIMEEFGKANLVEPYLATAVLSGRLIAALTGGERKEELLGGIIGGERQLACAYAEENGRYNLARVSTRAVTDGDDVVINGKKVAVLNADNADRLLVVARESGEETDREGVSVFLVDADSDGISRRAFPTIDGRRAAEVEFSKVRIPASARLGEAGAALPALESVIDLATVASSAEAVGALEMLLQKTVEYSKTRTQFGVPIGSFQALQHRMADMFIECQLARSIVIMAAMQLDSNEAAAVKARAVSAAKSRVGKAIRRVGQEAIQIHGGIGTTEELDVGHFFKRVTAIDLLFGDGDYHTDRYATLK